MIGGVWNQVTWGHRVACGRRHRQSHLKYLTQTLPHHVYVLYVEEEELAILVVVLAFIAAARGYIGDRVDVWPRVHYEQLVLRVARVQLEESVQVFLVRVAPLLRETHQGLTASQESGPVCAAVIFDPADDGYTMLRAELANFAQLLVRHRLGHHQLLRVRVAEAKVLVYVRETKVLGRTQALQINTINFNKVWLTNNEFQFFLPFVHIRLHSRTYSSRWLLRRGIFYNQKQKISSNDWAGTHDAVWFHRFVSLIPCDWQIEVVFHSKLKLSF